MSSDIQFKGYAITNKNKRRLRVRYTHPHWRIGQPRSPPPSFWVQNYWESGPSWIRHRAKTGFKVGDHVGVGAHIGSCGECRACKTDNENYCPKGLDTYNSPYPDGTISQGGFGTAIRANHRFVFPIPEKHVSLRAGLTVFSPLIRNGCGPGKEVGIVGLDGLLSVLRSTSCLTVTIRRLTQRNLGADHFVETTKKENMEPLQYSLDIIISTVDVTEGYPLKVFLSLLFVNGIFINVGIPESSLPQIGPFDIVSNGARLRGFLIGSKKEAIQMLLRHFD
ncbi:NADP-dependent alcohol dehydrogenase [Ceratobasidium sp. 395]|nr:NADP-dependent alcohol dehydrogenase [Ceratobasidium sp. 395]